MKKILTILAVSVLAAVLAPSFAAASAAAKPVLITDTIIKDNSPRYPQSIIVGPSRTDATKAVWAKVDSATGALLVYPMAPTSTVGYTETNSNDILTGVNLAVTDIVLTASQTGVKIQLASQVSATGAEAIRAELVRQGAWIAPTTAMSATPVYTAAAGASGTVVLPTGTTKFVFLSWESPSSSTFGVVSLVAGSAANASGVPVAGGYGSRYEETMAPVGATGASRYISSTFGPVKGEVITQ